MEAEKYVQPGENREKVKQLRALGYGATRIARDLDISRSRVYQLIDALAKTEQETVPHEPRD